MPDTCNVAAALAAQAQRRPQAVALNFPVARRGGKIRYAACTWSELDGLSDDYARGLLEHGMARGMRAALMVPPGLDFFAVFYALFKAGIVPVLIDPGIGIRRLRSCLREADPHAFIGVTRAQLARKLLRWAPRSDANAITAGMRLGWGGIGLRTLGTLGARSSGTVLANSRPGEMAAILFTSGSTGVPKGVVYRHRHFKSQVDMLRSAFGICAGEVDLATFPPFALFDAALGMTTVVPLMDPTRPAKADPALLVKAIEEFEVTNIFGSPALVRVLARYAAERSIRLRGVRRVISAGAAVAPSVAEAMQRALDSDARVFTPYGATECLPVTNVSSNELSGAVQSATERGDGVCVGAPVAPNRVVVIGVCDGEIPVLEDAEMLPPGVPGEIVVHGPTTTDAYWGRERQTRLAKMTDAEGRVWHRMGDVGCFDDQGRLWYCGRKSQRVVCDAGTLYAEQIEGVFNTHPEVARSALVGVGEPPRQTPVLCVELEKSRGGRPKWGDHRRIRRELLALAATHPRCRAVETVLFHRDFPVDIRHNAKIGRESLARWAARRLA